MYENYYVVSNEEDQYLGLRRWDQGGKLYAHWGDVKVATQFQTKEDAIDQTKKDVLTPFESLTLHKVEMIVHPGEAMDTTALKLDNKRKQNAFDRIAEFVPVSREELDLAVKVVMEGNGQLIGTREADETVVHSLFEEVYPNGCVIKKGNVDLT